MAFTLDKVVPWGRSYDEYVAMFALSERDIGGRILGCGDGPAAFNSVLTKRGGRAVSADPLYQFSAEEIQGRNLNLAVEGVGPLRVPGQRPDAPAHRQQPTSNVLARVPKGSGHDVEFPALHSGPPFPITDEAPAGRATEKAPGSKRPETGTES